MIKPITPSEADHKPIPDFVIECVNELITREYRNGYASFRKDDLISLIKSKNSKFELWWLDFEPLYRNAGWEVTYDQPGYNETYPAIFIFERKV